MNTESSRMRQAVAKVSEELLAMSPEEFRAQLDAHKCGDVALALQEVWSMAQAPGEPVPAGALGDDA